MAIHNTTLWSQQLKKLKKDLTPKYIYIYSLAILSSQIDVWAAALTQAQTHKKRETEKATKQWPPMVLLDCTKCAHSRQNVQRDSDKKHAIFSLSLSKIYKTSYGSWINIALWFYLSLSLLQIYIYINHWTATARAGWLQQRLQNCWWESPGETKKRKRKKKKGEQQQQRR